MQRRIQGLVSGILIVIVMLAVVPISGAQNAEVFVEAVGQANVRTGPGVDYPVVGEILTGTRYRVIARHTLVPWLRIEYPDAQEAWVYTDLVTVTGDLSQVPPISDFAGTTTPTSSNSQTITPTGTLTNDDITPTDTPAAEITPVETILPSASPTIEGPTVLTTGDTNVRFGPGVEYPSIVEVPAGVNLPIIELHALVPWIRVSLPDSPAGNGWVFGDIVEIVGDTSRIPLTNALQYNVPELTPTPQMIVVDGVPWKDATPAPGQLASTLGEEMHSYLLEQGYVPFTDQFASVFVMDLATGDTFTLNGGIAYSGMSLTKIPILVTYFQRHNGPISSDEAFLIADTMMCSENITTNQLLEQIGDGDMLQGAQRVTATMQRLDLNSTFIMRQYVVQENEPTMNLGTIHTGVDQSSARPDLYNQVVPEELGWLLASIYQCAENETGLLMERFPNDFSAQECRQMLYALDSNEIGVFLEAGVPDDVRVVHKHGWISDTHGDAGIVVEPDRAYVFVTTLYSEDWLEFDYSAPVIAELSRMTWNAFNPDDLLEATHPEIVPATCDPRTDPVMEALRSDNLPMIGS